MRYEIQATLRDMGRNELLAMVDPLRLEAIRAKDATPEIRAYVIAHEGRAEGNLVGYGKKVINYFADAVRRIHDRVGLGTPLFHRHAADNSHAGREPIGEIVGKALMEVGGKLCEVIAAWIQPAFRDTPLDIASIEAEVEFQERGDGTLSPVSVESVSGVALSSSAVERPGFPEARLLAACQAFVEGEDGSKEPEKGIVMKREEIVKAIEEGGFSVKDIFGDKVKDDEFVAGLIATEVEAQTTHLTNAKKAIETRLGKKLEAAEADLATARREAVQHRTSGVLESLATERKLTDAQKAFVQKRIGQFKTEAGDEEGLKADLQKHLDTELREYGDWAKLFGVDAGGEKKDDGTPPGDGNGPSTDYTDPKANDFIPS